MNKLLDGSDRMKAARLHKYGKPDGFVYEDVEKPTPTSNQVLIKVESVSVNYADLMRRRNDSYPYPTPLPAILGGEVAGTVAAENRSKVSRSEILYLLYSRMEGWVAMPNTRSLMLAKPFPFLKG